MPKGVIRAVSFLGVMVLLSALPLGHALAASDDAPDHAIIPGLENHKDLDPAMAGLILLGELNCASCHDAGAKANLINTKAAPDLSSVGQRINPKYLAKFIADPTATKPGTTMPNVMAKLNANQRSAAANAITHYLASLSKESFDRETATSKVDPKAAPRGNTLFHSVGCVACHSPRDENQKELLAANSVPLGKLTQKYNIKSLTAFIENPLAVRQSGRMPDMGLGHWQANDIAHFLMQDARKEQNTATIKKFKVDAAIASKGKSLFANLGCASCHKINDVKNAAKYPALAQLDTSKGCLSGKTGNWPQFKINEGQQTAIIAALKAADKPPTDTQKITKTLTSFNCIACHQRGDINAIAKSRNDYFKTDDQNLGEQGRMPPTLTWVGAKLRQDWLRKVLVHGKSIRPYMHTKMPKFGEANIGHLIKLFANVDKLPAIKFPELGKPNGRNKIWKEARDTGQKLVGRDLLNCVACHQFKSYRAEAMQAVDLAYTAERVRKDWFYHFSLNPQRFWPNTVMPTYWPGGVAARKDILKGDTVKQINAIWTYLSEGHQARLPRGMIREPLTITVKNEAVMLRRSIAGIIKRGIGVGYPGGVNLAFDAREMRLAAIWKGQFVDAGGVWSGQGSGSLRMMGTDKLNFPKGLAFAILKTADAPWPIHDPKLDGPHIGIRFKGYTLDKKRRPVFKYQFGKVMIEDYPINQVDPKSGKTYLKRTLSFTCDTKLGKHYFRAAKDSRIEALANNTFQVGKTLRIRIGGGQAGKLRAGAGGKELIVPLGIQKGKSTLVIEYLW